MEMFEINAQTASCQCFLQMKVKTFGDNELRMLICLLQVTCILTMVYWDEKRLIIVYTVEFLYYNFQKQWCCCRNHTKEGWCWTRIFVKWTGLLCFDCDRSVQKFAVKWQSNHACVEVTAQLRSLNVNFHDLPINFMFFCLCYRMICFLRKPSLFFQIYFIQKMYEAWNCMLRDQSNDCKTMQFFPHGNNSDFGIAASHLMRAFA